MNRSSIYTMSLLLLASPAAADPRDDAMSAMLRCTGLGDAARRLVCYDATVGRVRGAMLQPLSDAVPPPASMPLPQHRGDDHPFGGLIGNDTARRPQTTAQQFGSESIASAGERAYPLHHEGDTIDAITARLVRYSVSGDGRLTVELDNGQEWRQSSGGSPIRQLSKPALSYTVEITREAGATGNYAMNLSGVSKTFLVRRIK